MVHLQEWILLYVHTGYNDAKYTSMNLIQTTNKQKQTLLCTADKDKRLLRALFSAVLLGPATSLPGRPA